MVINSISHVVLKENDNLEKTKFRDLNIWVLFGVVAVYFSISFLSRVADYIDDIYFRNENHIYQYNVLLPVH